MKKQNTWNQMEQWRIKKLNVVLYRQINVIGILEKRKHSYKCISFMCNNFKYVTCLKLWMPLLCNGDFIIHNMNMETSEFLVMDFEWKRNAHHKILMLFNIFMYINFHIKTDNRHNWKPYFALVFVPGMSAILLTCVQNIL